MSLCCCCWRPMQPTACVSATVVSGICSRVVVSRIQGGASVGVLYCTKSMWPKTSETEDLVLVARATLLYCASHMAKKSFGDIPKIYIILFSNISDGRFWGKWPFQRSPYSRATHSFKVSGVLWSIDIFQKDGVGVLYHYQSKRGIHFDKIKNSLWYEKVWH